MTYNKFTEISDCAAASDGGSLWVCLAGPEGKAGFTLVRSLASQGTSLFGQVIDDDGQPLAAHDTYRLCHCLRGLQDAMRECRNLVQEFSQAAEQRAAHGE